MESLSFFLGNWARKLKRQTKVTCSILEERKTCFSYLQSNDQHFKKVGQNSQNRPE
jgi:hypothetical protein